MTTKIVIEYTFLFNIFCKKEQNKFFDMKKCSCEGKKLQTFFISASVSRELFWSPIEYKFMTTIMQYGILETTIQLDLYKIVIEQQSE